MADVMSWWVLALIIGGSSPLWVRALADRWERKARERTERMLADVRQEQRETGREEP